jgi:hypothetical protein
MLQADSLAPDTASQIAWMKISPSPSAYENTRGFRQCRIFYGHNPEPFINEIFDRDQRIDAAIIPPSKDFKVIRWTLDAPVTHMTVQFRYAKSPEIYGMAFDNTSGIAVDNISLRGCAGLIFTSMDPRLLREMYKELNVKLFILQFGGNVVPYIADNYRYYEKWYYRQIMRLKEVCPGASVLVIGVADMAVKNGEKFESYPNLGIVNQALRSVLGHAEGHGREKFNAGLGQCGSSSCHFRLRSFHEKRICRHGADVIQCLHLRIPSF